jgi:hypothetical protein
MKKSIRIFFITGLLVFTTALVWAQMDAVRMQRDIRVASSVLQTLSQTDNSFVMYGDNVSGEYIDGYGVMFSIGGGYSVMSSKRSGAVVVGGSNRTEVRTGNSREVVSAPDADEKQDLLEDDLEPITDIREVMTTFLVDYSQLIGQLQSTDKIVVSTKKSDYIYYFKMDDGDESKVSSNNGLTAELLKKDHDNFLSGKLSKDQLIEKINYVEHGGENERSKDLDLFAAMIKTLYNVDYTDTYFVSWTPEYEIISGIGAVYTFKVFSSYDENGLYRMPGINEEGLTEPQRQEKVKELYPLFTQTFKENLIQYGRAINSLDGDEMLMIRITMTKCDNCGIPKKVQFTVKQSVLTQYNTGKIKLEDALNQVKFSEL